VRAQLGQEKVLFDFVDAGNYEAEMGETARGTEGYVECLYILSANKDTIISRSQIAFKSQTTVAPRRITSFNKRTFSSNFSFSRLRISSGLS
jgi:hypothetical protein